METQIVENIKGDGVVGKCIADANGVSIEINTAHSETIYSIKWSWIQRAAKLLTEAAEKETVQEPK